MSSIGRGSKNAFRNIIRTVAIVLILGISIGLALVMFLSLKTVDARINSVKSTIGNTILVSPAGSSGFEGGGEPLYVEDIDSLKSLSHVEGISSTLSERLTPGEDTNLESGIERGTLGDRRQSNQSADGQQGAPGGMSGGGPGQDFKMPVMITGVDDLDNTQVIAGGELDISSGSDFDPKKDVSVALVGKDLAEKNNLEPDSEFEVYGESIKVVGVFDADSRFANNTILMPISSLQRLTGYTDEVSQATVQVDSIDNLASTQKEIKNTLGDKADVVDQQDASEEAVEPLENIKTIATYSLIGALVAGSVIIFLTMLMIVRERRREIGVLKAIGASNYKIVLQFITEALVLTLVSSIVGIVVGLVLSNPVLGVLVANNSPNPATGGGSHGGMQGMRMTMGAIGDITAVVSYDIILYGLLAAVIIAIIGSALPAWFIAKIRPAEVLRGE